MFTQKNNMADRLVETPSIQDHIEILNLNNMDTYI
jgi:hypothetical protein